MNTQDLHDHAIPAVGADPKAILDHISHLHEQDVAWKDGRAWSLIYYANEEHEQLLQQAHRLLFNSNFLNPFAFKSLQTLEHEVVAMTTKMLHGNEEVVGVVSSGGTESILLALFSYRQRAAKLQPSITRPEVVAPATIHPAFDKAATLFGLTLRKAPVDENRRAVPGRMEKLINKNTILLVASAPSYPNGVLDPIEEIAAFARQYQLPFHVDACVGGFMLPWLEKLGHKIPKWDFRVNGVSSISADVHKFGFGAKGASVLAYTGMDYLKHQFILTTDFPGGIYVSPTILGTRPGGPLAAAWAAMKHLGENGYLQLAQQLMDGANKLRRGLESIASIVVVGDPCMNIISYTTRNNRPDIFVVADQLENKGWMVDRQQFPECIHLTVLPTNLPVIDEYLSDLKLAIAFAEAHPEATAKGNAALYGLMARIPFRGMVEKNVVKILEEMYSAGKFPTPEKEPEQKSIADNNPAWMGRLSRFLSWLKRIK